MRLFVGDEAEAGDEKLVLEAAARCACAHVRAYARRGEAHDAAFIIVVIQEARLSGSGGMH